MPIIKVNKSDLDKFRPVDNQGWKVVTCLDISEGKAAKSGTSINYWDTLRILAPDDSDKDLEFGVCCNTDGGFSVAPMLAASQNVTTGELFGDQKETDLELNAMVGRTWEAKVGHRLDDNNRVNNDVQEWAPLGTNFPKFNEEGTEGEDPPF